MTDFETTEFIVLRQTPYRESDLIFAGLSPDFGKLELIAYRAGKSSGRDFPVIDLFRRLRVSFKSKSGQENAKIGQVVEAELLDAFPDLPCNLENLKFVSRIGKFLLRNTVEDSPLPMVFDVMCNLLANLTAGQWNRLDCAVLLKLTFLYENGLLPDDSGLADGARRKLAALYEKLIECAMDGTPLPELSSEYYKRLDDYLNSRIAASNLPWA